MAPHIVKLKATKAIETASASAGGPPKSCPKPCPISTTNAPAVNVPTEPLEKSEGSATLASAEPAPPLHRGQCVRKAKVLPNASELSREKNALKISAWEAKLEKEAKEVVQQKNVEALAVYENRVKEMGFESTPLICLRCNKDL